MLQAGRSTREAQNHAIPSNQDYQVPNIKDVRVVQFIIRTGLVDYVPSLVCHFAPSCVK
jgi:hypothetical protein